MLRVPITNFAERGAATGKKSAFLFGFGMSMVAGVPATDINHMPAFHKFYASRSDLILKVAEIGGHPESWVRSVFETCLHLEPGYRMVSGMFHLLKAHSFL